MWESGSGNTANKQYTCRYTVASGNTGTFSTKVGTNTADLAGNTVASAYTHSATLTMDTTLPTITEAAFNGSTITLTMSETVKVTGTKTGGDFTVTGGGAPTVSSYTISGSTVTLTLSAVLPFGSTVTLAYAKNSTAANRITDSAGNELAAVSSQSVKGKSVSVSAVSTDDYINAAEDDSAILIAGTSTDLTTGTAVTITIDDGDSDTAIDLSFTVTTDSSGNWTTGSGNLTAARLAALDEGAMTITASAPDAESGTRTVSYDRTAPTASYSIITDGANTDGTKSFLAENDTVSLNIAMSERVAAAPIVQFKNGANNFGSAVTAVKATVVYSNAAAAGDTASTTDAIDFGAPSGGSFARETVASGGYVYKTTAAFDSLYISVSGDAGTGVALVGRTHSSAPTSATINSVGTQLFSVGSRGASATVFGSARLTDVASGTYFWFYPSDTNSSRTITNREMTVLSGIAAGETIAFSSGSQAPADSAGDTDPIDFGAVSDDGIDREALGSGYIYKTNEDFRRLYIGTDAQFSAGGSYRARMAATAPETSAITSHGTEMWSRSVTGGQSYSGGKVLADVPSGTYFWFYPTTANSLTNRLLEFRGTNDIVNKPVYAAAHTVASGENIASGNLKYDVTNESLLTDAAGNALATQAVTTIDNVVMDTTVPTIASGSYSASTITLILSEEVWASPAPANGDFVLTVSGGGTQTVTGVTIGGSVGAASSTVSLALSSVILADSTVSLAYTAGTNKIQDTAGNEVVSAGSVSIADASTVVQMIIGSIAAGAAQSKTVSLSGITSGADGGVQGDYAVAV